MATQTNDTSSTDRVELAEQLWGIIATIRDTYPRRVNDAPTDEIIKAILGPIGDALTRAAAEGIRVGKAGTDGGFTAEGIAGHVVMGIPFVDH